MEIQKKEIIRQHVRGCYDIQKLRIAMGNRICTAFKTKIGIQPGEKEDEDKEKAKILNIVTKDYKLVSQGVSKAISLSQFKGHGVIGDYTEYCLAHSFFGIKREEEEHMKMIQYLIKDIPIWKDWLKTEVVGCGPAMAGVIISEIDIEKAKYPSSLFMYSGLDVAPDGKGRSRKKEHLIDVEYKNKEGEIKQKKSITFNPLLKTKLIGVLGPSFIRQKDYYAGIYNNYRNRIDNNPKYDTYTKKHRYNMAVRYMIKQFLIDLHVNWRTIEGLPVSKPYHEAKLGLYHKAA
jgi:hypothetical protein